MISLKCKDIVLNYYTNKDIRDGTVSKMCTWGGLQYKTFLIPGFCFFEYPTKAATILRLLGNETIQFNTRGKKGEPGLRKQLNIDVKSTTKFYISFKYMNIFIYFTNIRRFRFSILYFKYLQTLILCVTTFYKTAFYYNVFRRCLKSSNIKKFKVSYILHYECVFFPKLNKLSNFFPVVWFVTSL